MAEMVNLLLCMVVVGGLVAQSCPTLAIPWTVAHHAPLPMGFSRWEYWSDLPFPSPRDLPDPGIKPRSPALQADSLLTELQGKLLKLCYVSVQFSSATQSCPTLCDPMNCSMPGFPVHHQLPEFAQTHVHWVSDAIQPSHPAVPFSSHLQSFPASGSFPMSQFFASGGQSIGVSASVLPVNFQDGLPLGWTGWISLLPRDYQQSSPIPQFKSISSSA